MWVFLVYVFKFLYNFASIFGGKVWRTPAEQLRWKLQKSRSLVNLQQSWITFYPALNQNDQQFWKLPSFLCTPWFSKKTLGGFALRVSTSQSTFGWSWRHMAPTGLHHHGLQQHDRFPSQKPRCRTKVLGRSVPKTWNGNWTSRICDLIGSQNPSHHHLESYWEVTRSPTRCSLGSRMIMWGFLNHWDVPRIFQRASHQVMSLANTMCAVRASGSVCKNSLDANDYPDVCFGPKRGNDFSLWWFPLDHLGTRGNFHSNNKKNTSK